MSNDSTNKVDPVIKCFFVSLIESGNIDIEIKDSDIRIDCYYATSKEILKLIEQVNRKYGNTVVMVTHNNAIEKMADRVVKLHDGRIRENCRNETRMAAEDLEW